MIRNGVFDYGVNHPIFTLRKFNKICTETNGKPIVRGIRDQQGLEPLLRKIQCFTGTCFGPLRLSYRVSRSEFCNLESLILLFFVDRWPSNTGETSPRLRASCNIEHTESGPSELHLFEVRYPDQCLGNTLKSQLAYAPSKTKSSFQLIDIPRAATFR